MDDLMKLDLYNILGVSDVADVKVIKKAYRKKALKCHPDKNPNDPNAAKLFDQLQKIHELLTNEKQRAIYDQQLKSRKAAKLREEKLDSARQQYKRDLEKREQEASIRRNEANAEEVKINRLRKQGMADIENYAKKCRFTSNFSDRCSFTKAAPTVVTPAATTASAADDDFELSVLKAMKEAQEKKRMAQSN